MRPLRAELIPAALARYPAVSRLDLSLCRRVGDATLACVIAALRYTLRTIDLSRSRSFDLSCSRSFLPAGLESLAGSCAALVEIGLSNVMDLTDAAAATIGKARNLERLWLARCMRVTDMGIGYIAVECPKLRLLCLKWCLGAMDLGVGLVAVKCRMLRSLELSYTAFRLLTDYLPSLCWEEVTSLQLRI